MDIFLIVIKCKVSDSHCNRYAKLDFNNMSMFTKNGTEGKRSNSRWCIFYYILNDIIQLFYNKCLFWCGNYTNYCTPNLQTQLCSGLFVPVKITTQTKKEWGKSVQPFSIDELLHLGLLIYIYRCTRFKKKKERFLGFIELNELNAQALCNGLILFLNNTDLDIGKFVSLSYYDGASVMSG